MRKRVGDYFRSPGRACLCFLVECQVYIRHECHHRGGGGCSKIAAFCGLFCGSLL